MKKVLFFLINIFLGGLSLFSEEKLNLELLEKYYNAENIPAFCKVANLDEIKKNDYSLKNYSSDYVNLVHGVHGCRLWRRKL